MAAFPRLRSDGLRCMIRITGQCLETTDYRPSFRLARRGKETQMPISRLADPLPKAFAGKFESKFPAATREGEWSLRHILPQRQPGGRNESDGKVQQTA
jgi:hypothetical protein